MHTIYLDHATTTPLAASVREAMLPFLQNMYGHPSSNHWMGRVAAEAIEDARSSLSSLLECHPNDLIFTSGGTESVNLALLGLGRAIQAEQDDPHCIISNAEHAAVRQSAAQLAREGWSITVVPCNVDGLIEIEQVAKAIRKQTRIISITHASHEIGTLQPIDEISSLCSDKEIFLHTDAAQTVGKIEVSPQKLGVDLLSLSGHKFYGPKGVGALYVRQGVPIAPILFGDENEAGLRSGTASVAHIAGLGQAARLAQAGLSTSLDRVVQLRDKFHRNLEQLIGQSLPLLGIAAKRLPGILAMQLPNANAQALQRRLPEVCVDSTLAGLVCDGITAPSIWSSLGLSPGQLACTLRISIGWSTSEDELIQAAQMIALAYDSIVEDSSG